MSGNALILAISALVGFALAEDKALATLPVSLQFLGMMLTSIPASMMMQRWGRKFGFMLGSFLGLCGALLAVWAILVHQFWWFVVASMLIGVFGGFGTYFRFAAVEVAAEKHHAKAIAFVMAGGVVAAFVGPNLANIGRQIFSQDVYAGGFLFIASFYILILLILLLTKFPAVVITTLEKPSRPLKYIAKQPAFIVALICGALGYAVMSYLMTATPLAMKHHAHNFSDTAFVIQWHIVAMFAPSFFTGHIIERFGSLKVMLVGVILEAGCVFFNLLGQDLGSFWLALCLLGIGWNFLFIGATNLLTQTYREEEKGKTQALNDFLIFTLVTIASLSAGLFQHNYGWEVVNYGAIPLITIMLVSILWLMAQPKHKHLHQAVEVLVQ